MPERSSHCRGPSILRLASSARLPSLAVSIQYQGMLLQAEWLAEVDAAFSGTGIKSFVLEGALGELQVL